MKKHIIAAAVAAAVAVPAMAQNVTIGGNFDLAYDFSDRNATSIFTGEGVLTTPALTIGGSEDLGGGLKLFFNLNTRLGHVFEVDGNVGSNAAGQGNVAQRHGTLNFGDRGAQVGISGSFGELAFGKTTGTAIGSFIRGGVVGNLSLLTESSWGDRPNDVISYTTPDFNGLKVRYIYQTSTESYEASAVYTNGPLTVAAAINDVRAAAANANQANAAVVAGQDRGARISYNAGFATLNLSTVKMETITNNIGRSMYSVGVSVPVPMATGLTINAEVGNRETAAQADDKVTNVAAVYELSKRTNVYFAWQNIDSNNNNLSAVGVRHSF